MSAPKAAVSNPEGGLPVPTEGELPMVQEPGVPFVEIEGLRTEQFIPAAKEALTSLIAEQAQGKLDPPGLQLGGPQLAVPAPLGLACCAIEFASAFGARFDAERFGVVPRSSPRQCDLLIVNGTVTWKVAHKLITLYEQMPEPKWVIAMGNCATGAGRSDRLFRRARRR